MVQKWNENEDFLNLLTSSTLGGAVSKENM